MLCSLHICSSTFLLSRRLCRDEVNIRSKNIPRNSKWITNSAQLCIKHHQFNTWTKYFHILFPEWMKNVKHVKVAHEFGTSRAQINAHWSMSKIPQSWNYQNSLMYCTTYLAYVMSSLQFERWKFSCLNMDARDMESSSFPSSKIRNISLSKSVEWFDKYSMKFLFWLDHVEDDWGMEIIS